MMVTIPPDSLADNGNELHNQLLPENTGLFAWQDDFVPDRTHQLHQYDNAPIRPKHVDILLNERTNSILHPDDYVGESPSTEKIHDIAKSIQTANRDMEVYYVTCHRNPEQNAPLVALAGFKVCMVGNGEFSEAQADNIAQYVEERISATEQSAMVANMRRVQFWWGESDDNANVHRDELENDDGA